MNIPVKLIAVLVSAIVSMGLGFLWYSPLLFAKPWMKLMGYTTASMKEMQKKMGPMYGVSFLLALVMAYVLAYAIVLSKYYFHGGLLSTGLFTAFWLWLGFVMPVQMTGVIFSGRNFKLFLLDTGYQLTSLLVMSAIISYIK